MDVSGSWQLGGQSGSDSWFGCWRQDSGCTSLALQRLWPWARSEAFHTCREDDATPTLARQFPEDLNDIYGVEGFVGQGAFSTVWRAVHKTSGQVRAIKKIDTTDLSHREIAHEIAIMRFLRHENVVRCYDVFLQNQFVNVVMDLFEGGDLVDGLNLHRRAKGRLKNWQLRHLAKQMAAAVTHVHSLQIIHRDVKGENFLSDRPNIGDQDVRVALTDFGTSIRIDSGEKVFARVGTPAFWAPEVFHGPYDFKADVWALGVTIYILLTGGLPYEGQEDICKATPPIDPSDTDAVSRPPFKLPFHTAMGCSDFLKHCLTKEAAQRPSSRTVLQLQWLHNPPEDSPKAEEAELVEEEEIQRPSKIREVLEGLRMHCCGFIKVCMDRFCDPQEVEALAARWSKASSKRSSGKANTLTGVEKELLEKQATELSKQISSSLLHHQDSMKH